MEKNQNIKSCEDLFKVPTDFFIEYSNETYENMFLGFTKEEEIIIQDFMDTYFPINEDDWSK